MDDAIGVFECREGLGEGLRGHDRDPGAGAEQKRGLACGGIAAADHEAVLAAQIEKNR
jgi:hypothetical protein